MRQHAVLTLLGATLFGLSACGGGSGGGSDNPAPSATTVQVAVAPSGESGSVGQATVLLLRDSGAVTNKASLNQYEVISVATTRNDGFYRFEISDGALDQYVIVVQNIHDARYQVNGRIELIRALGDLTDDTTSVNVTPVSTLVFHAAASLDAVTLETSLADILADLGADAADSPTANLPLLSAFSLVEYFPSLIADIAAAPDQLSATLAALDLTTLPESRQTEATLRRDVAQAIIAAAQDAGTTDLASEANRIELAARIANLLDAAGTAYTDSYVDALAAAAIQANAGGSVGADSGATNVLRYLINTYGLGDSLTDEAPGAETVAAIEADPNIATLVASGQAVQVSVPLLDNELLGSDEDARRRYYYSSNASPINTVQLLFEGVTDANITDELQVALAEANVRAARIDEANFIAATQVFGTAKQADAYEQIGDRILDLPGSDLADARDAYRAALALRLDIVETKGVANLDGDDLAGLQTLIGSPDQGFIAIGDDESIAEASAVIDEFIDIVGGGEYTSAYARAVLSLRRYAEDLVERALAAGLNDAGLNGGAEQAVDQVAAAVRDANAAQHSGSACSEHQESGNEAHYLLRGIYMLDAADLYRQLGLNADVVAVLEDDLALLQPTNYAKCRLETYGDDIVEILTSIGETERAQDYIDNMLDADWKEEAEAAMALALADVERDAGNIEEAVDIILTQTTGSRAPRDIMFNLVYTQSNTRGLGGVLVDRGDYTQAKIAIDAAWDYYQSDAYQDYAASQDDGAAYEVYLNLSALRIVDLYAKAGYSDEAFAVLAALDTVVDDQVSGTPALRAEALIEMGRQYSYSGDDATADARLASARSVLDSISTPDDAITLMRELNRAQRDLSRYGEGELFDAAEAVRARVDDLCCDGVPDEELAEARRVQADNLIDLGSDLVDASYHLRALQWQAIRDGGDATTYNAHLATAINRARETLLAAASVTDTIANADDRVSDYGFITQYLAVLGEHDDVADVLARIENAPDRNDKAVNAAQALLRANPYSMVSDFPVRVTDGAVPIDFQTTAAPFARIDTDNDGLPNFFSPLADEATVTESGLMLDDDSDGDGTSDATDRTPLDPANV